MINDLMKSLDETGANVADIEKIPNGYKIIFENGEELYISNEKAKEIIESSTWYKRGVILDDLLSD